MLFAVLFISDRLAAFPLFFSKLKAKHKFPDLAENRFGLKYIICPSSLSRALLSKVSVQIRPRANNFKRG